jgi:hypothetical protein
VDHQVKLTHFHQIRMYSSRLRAFVFVPAATNS